MARKRIPTYNSEQGRVNSAQTIDEKIMKAKKELGLLGRPKNFTDRWQRITDDLKRMTVMSTPQFVGV